MKENIYLAPGSDGQELLKNLAMHGVNLFNTRICGAAELARLALMRSAVSVNEEFISRDEELPLIAEAVRDNTYFKNPSWSDIQQIDGAVRRMRSLVPEGNEDDQLGSILGKGEFQAKNTALLEVYRNYKALLNERRLIDSISLIRKALEQCAVMGSNTEFYILEDYPLNPLEKALLNRLSGGSYRKVTVPGLFGIAADQDPGPVSSCRNCYGAANEVEDILTDIYRNHPLDQCTIAATDPVLYSQLFFDNAVLYDIPVTFGCGIPIRNSYPAKLFSLYYHWMTDGFFGGDAVHKLLNSEFIDHRKLKNPNPDPDFSKSTFWEVLKGIRFTNDAQKNRERLADFQALLDQEEASAVGASQKEQILVRQKRLCIPWLEILARELALPAEEFIAKYAFIRKGSSTETEKLLMMLDIAAAAKLRTELELFRSVPAGRQFEEMASDILNMTVYSGGSEAGKLYVTDINGAMTSVRENLYIAGLSAANYPGSPRENHLLLDKDLELFGKDENEVYKAETMMSAGKIRQRRNRLLGLVRLAGGLGASIHISYAGMNVSELKKENASSLVYELTDEEPSRVGYFDPEISKTREIGRAYIQGEIIENQLTGKVKDSSPVSCDLATAYSPSALSDYFKCPRRFFLSRIMGIPEPDDVKPFDVFSGGDRGTVAHELMEALGNSNMSKEDFLLLSGDYFDRYVSGHPPFIPRMAEKERKVFLGMMGVAYDMDPRREVVLEEEDVECMHESGVKLHGFPDRVEKLEDGSHLVVDFKSGRTVEHTEDDIDTCLQIVIYASVP